MVEPGVRVRGGQLTCGVTKALPELTNATFYRYSGEASGQVQKKSKVVLYNCEIRQIKERRYMQQLWRTTMDSIIIVGDIRRAVRW